MDWEAQQESMMLSEPSIYKVPISIKELNATAYQPRVVSFGPYHHGKERLISMEKHKRRALDHFLKRTDKPGGPYLEALHEVEPQLKKCYDQLDETWLGNDEKFLNMMLLDGCFMLEILRTVGRSSGAFLSSQDRCFEGYDRNDPVFSNHWELNVLPLIRRDMLMLENQMPLKVLERLIYVADGKERDYGWINMLILNLLSPSSVSRIGLSPHLLNTYRHSVLYGGLEFEMALIIPGKTTEIMGSATELHEAGIKFNKYNTFCVEKVKFRDGALGLPIIAIDDATESTFLNLIAFERLHTDAGRSHVCSYVSFMGCLIRTPNDVRLLRAQGIISNALGSDKVVAQLFNSLSRDVVLDPRSRLNVVQIAVIEYCKKRRNVWRANLVQTHFGSPWALVALLASISALLLALLQTVFTVYGTFHK